MMPLVLVTTTKDSTLAEVAGVVSETLKKIGHDEICIIKTNTIPYIVRGSTMTATDETIVFIFGLGLENQGQAIRYELELSQALGFRVEIV